MADKKKGKRKSNPTKQMTLWGHLGELRTCIFVCVGTFLVATMVSYTFADDVVQWAINHANGYRFIQTGVAELMGQYIKVSIICGLVLSTPIIAWQIYRFVAPGLKKSEEIKFLTIMIGGLALFVVGAVFAYMIVIPFTLDFFMSINTIEVEGLYSIKEYIGYLTQLTFSFGVIFEIPVIAALLTWIGILKPRHMKAARRIVYVLCVVAGAIITPPDVVSQIMVAVPMVGLYEISIVISSAIYATRPYDDDELEEKKPKSERAERWAAAKRIVDMQDANKNK